jgi:glucosamine--fructose-6-phosphate aminotransferase (isomerizing)
MCGIVGAVVAQGAVLEGLLEGLRALEYRGYDSAGVAVMDKGGIAIRRKAGRIQNLEESLSDGALSGARAGIGHTRWATHGKPSDVNAHPHTDAAGRVALVHNGIFENYAELRAELEAAGVQLASDTDTEVLAHLIGRALARGVRLYEATLAALRRVRGYYAIAALSIEDGVPRLVCARQGPPLAVAVTPEGAWLGSDVLALIAWRAWTARPCSARRAASTGMSKLRARAASRTTCSRKSTSSRTCWRARPSTASSRKPAMWIWGNRSWTKRCGASSASRSWPAARRCTQG